MPVPSDPFLLDRMFVAVEKVRERLTRAAAALTKAEIGHAVVGGHAVPLWVEAFGEGGERNTPNRDFLICRIDLARATAALEEAGFVAVGNKPDLFLDGLRGSLRTRLRLIFSSEKVCASDLLPNPGCQEVEHLGLFAVLSVAALVQTKLVAHRTVDRVHLRDLLDVGLINQTWTQRYPPELAERLQTLLDDPDG